MPHYVALDLETEQIAKMPNGKIHAVFFDEGGDDGAFCVEWEHNADAYIRAYLLKPDVTFIIQNAAFDVWVLRAHGVDIPPGRYVDTMVAAHCINPQLGDYSLAAYGDSVDSPKVDYPKELANAGLWAGKLKDPAVYDVQFNPVMERYGLQDVRLTRQWWVDDILPHLESDERLAKAYYELHLPAVEVTISLSGGLHIDLAAAYKVAVELQAEIEGLYVEFAKRYRSVAKVKWDADKREFKILAERHPPNLASPNDMVSLLMQHGWIPKEFKRGTGRPVTSQAVLGRLLAEPDTPSELRECVGFIANLRSLVGIQQQVVSLLELQQNALVKGNWHQTGTKTFRYSSSSPNMQNLSTRHRVWGKRVRAIFTPPPGYSLILGDLSQIELAIVAWYLEVLCGDSAAADGNRAGKDAHDTNTENWYRVSKDAEDFKLLRGRAKNGAFAANYGAKADRLALTIGCSKQEAQDILDTVEGATQITPLKELVWATMRTERDVKALTAPYSNRKVRYGFLYDCLGTRLFYPNIKSSDRFERESAQRQSFNALAQGGCASILRKLCVESLPYISAGKGWFAASVHDEALVYVKTEHAEATLDGLNKVWNSLVLPSPQGGVYVRADFKIANNWSDK